ncbi:acyl carrier protein [Actinomadura atramentaria]|uniref:acyl carrier protein n=1 Tax=Actinomadura atramentaria TaxID=1990 RepID=UPI00037C4D65|nr:acyl carrier protein [Actinomadura atramentaria]
MATKLTLDDLLEILRDAAGDSEEIAGATDVLDTEFAQLGYDSLALLETAGRIERDHGIELDDSTVAESPTPRALLDVVNERLAQAAAV